MHACFGACQDLAASLQQLGCLAYLFGEVVDAKSRVVDFAEDRFQTFHGLLVAEILFTHELQIRKPQQLAFYRFQGMRFARFLLLAACLGVLSCLEAPSAPAGVPARTAVSVHILVGADTLDNFLLSGGAQYRLLAQTVPAGDASGLSFSWTMNGEPIGSGPTSDSLEAPYSFTGVRSGKLIAVDSRGNADTVLFSISFGHAPIFVNTGFSPANGDTIAAFANDLLTIQWFAADQDSHDTIDYRVQFAAAMDSLSVVEYHAGSALRISIGDPGEGAWRYRVLASDPLGLADTSAWQNFTLIRRVYP